MKEFIDKLREVFDDKTLKEMLASKKQWKENFSKYEDKGNQNKSQKEANNENEKSGDKK